MIIIIEWGKSIFCCSGDQTHDMTEDDQQLNTKHGMQQVNKIIKALFVSPLLLPIGVDDDVGLDDLV